MSFLIHNVILSFGITLGPLGSLSLVWNPSHRGFHPWGLVALLIQGLGPHRSSPERHSFIGQIGVQIITNYKEIMSLYTFPTLGRRNKAQKT